MSKMPPKPVKLRSISGGALSTWRPPNLKDWLAQEVNDRPWILEGLVPSDSLVLMSGQQKRTMKTYNALTMALSAAMGRQISLFKPKRRHKVLFIEEEGAHVKTKERIEALVRTYGAKDKDLENIFFAFRNRVKLNKPSWRQNICKFIEQEGISLVFLDAIVYLHEGDENKVNEMAPVIDALQGMRAAGASVVFIAHLNGSRGEDKKADIDTQVRGAGIIVNCYDVHLAYRRYKMSDGHIDLLVRPRDDEEKLYSVAFSFEKEGEHLSKASLSMVQRLDDELDLEKLSAKLLSQFGVGEVVTKAAVKMKSELSKSNFDKVFDYCLEKNKVSKDGSKYIIEGD